MARGWWCWWCWWGGGGKLVSLECRPLRGKESPQSAEQRRNPPLPTSKNPARVSSWYQMRNRKRITHDTPPTTHTHTHTHTHTLTPSIPHPTHPHHHLTISRSQGAEGVTQPRLLLLVLWLLSQFIVASFFSFFRNAFR